MLKHRGNLLSILAVALFASIALTFACADDDDNGPTSPVEPGEPHGPGEEELITTLMITLTPSGGGAPVTARFQDLDGEGGNNPVVDKLTVTKGTNYDGSVRVLNEAESPAENITEEVEEEAEAHQFFYDTLGGFASATVTITDKESDYVTNTGADHPVGIEFTLSVPENALDGQLRIRLSHYDDAPKDGTSLSDETDIDVTFDVEVSP